MQTVIAVQWYNMQQWLTWSNVGYKTILKIMPTYTSILQKFIARCRAGRSGLICEAHNTQLYQITT